MLTLERVHVFNNSVTSDGGGIYVGYECNFYMIDSTVSHNNAIVGLYAGDTTSSGGGLYYESSVRDVHISGSTVSFNHAPGNGGGIYLNNHQEKG